MKPTILVAAAPGPSRVIATALRDDFTLVTVTDPGRARLLVTWGDYAAIVTAPGFFDHPNRSRWVIVDPADPAITDKVLAAVAARRNGGLAEAREVGNVATLRYDEFIDLVRGSATRRYLLALMLAHHGSVTAAARAAGIMRESLHRLLRRHDIDAEVFRSSRSDAQ